MSKDLVRYDLMIQEALRSVVRRVMADAQKHGLAGEHHFFIRFKTGAPGVRVSNWLREQFPDEMNIVLQHQYWDLKVTDHAFEVGLSFRGTPERLLVPFEAVVEFQDPSVRFGLVFEPAEGEAGNDDEAAAAKTAARPPAELRPAGGRLTGDPLKRKDARAVEAIDKAARKDAKTTPLPLKKEPPAKGAPAAETPAKGEPAKDSAPKPPAEVVSLDQFRKKK